MTYTMLQGMFEKNCHLWCFLPTILVLDNSKDYPSGCVALIKDCSSQEEHTCSPGFTLKAVSCAAARALPSCSCALLLLFPPSC